MRVNVNMDERLVKKLDLVADNMYMSRSALISMLCGQGLYGLDKGEEIAKALSGTNEEELTSLTEYASDVSR